MYELCIRAVTGIYGVIIEDMGFWCNRAIAANEL